MAAVEEKWHRARLIPTSGITGTPEQERRGASVFLAILAAVPEFGRVLTSRLGAPAGKIETFAEVEFLHTKVKLRPDGLIRVQRGTRSWIALVEVKTMRNSLLTPQVESYLDIAREKGYDAVITISNEIAPEPGGHPLNIDKRKLRKVSLSHLSWSEVRTEALIEQVNHSITNPDHAWLLSEFIAYLEDPRSGTLDFDDMGTAWVTVRDAAISSTLRPGDKAAADVVSRFAELISFSGMELSRQLGVEVRPTSNRRDAAEFAVRLQQQVAELAATGKMSGTLSVPNTVAPLLISVDLRAGRVSCSSAVSAPTTKVRPSARVNWLLRQLDEAPRDLTIQAVRARSRSGGPTARLDKITEDPEVLVEDPHMEIREFVLTLSRPAGTKRGQGRGSFVGSVLTVVEDFYALVVQHLKPWAPSPPKVKPTVIEAEPDVISFVSVGTEPPLGPGEDLDGDGVNASDAARTVSSGEQLVEVPFDLPEPSSLGSESSPRALTRNKPCRRQAKQARCSRGRRR